MAEANVSVLVSGIPTDTSENAIRLLFKNEARSGGGEIQNLDFHSEEGKAVITFTDNSVAERVATRKQVEYHGQQLFVTTVTGNTWNRKTVLVTTSDGNLSKEQLELIFESEKKSGGGPIDTIEVKHGEHALITFKKEEDAASVLKKGSVKMEEKTYIVKMPPAPPSVLWDRLTVEVSGFTPSVHKDDLLLLYEDKDSSGGGPIETVNILKEEGIAMIKFKDEKDAASVIEKANAEWEGSIIKAVVPISKAKAKRKADRKCIIVSEVDPNWNEAKLKLFFNNNSQSGGSDVESVEINTNKNMAVVRFVLDDVAEAVLQKHQSTQLSLCGVNLNISISTEAEALEQLRDTSEIKPKSTPHTEPLDIESCAISVTNLPVDIGKEILTMFFEVEKQSGGGPTEQIVHIPEERKAVITYFHSNAAKRVFQKYQSEGLNIEETPVRVAYMKSKCAEMEITDAHEQKSVCLKDIPEDTDIGEIKQYLEDLLTSCCVKDITFGSIPCRALVSFIKFPGFEALYQIACQKPLKTNMVKMETVEKPTKIEVCGIGDLSSQKLQLYFEHSKSQGGNVTNVQFLQDDDIAIVTFEHHTDALKVSQKYDHGISNEKFAVQLHYDCIGMKQDMVATNIGKSKTIIVDTSDERIITFVMGRQKHKSAIEMEMKDIGAEVLWDDTSGKEVHLRLLTKSPVKLKGDAWIKQVKEKFIILLTEYCVEDFPVSTEAWEEFIASFEKDKPTSDDELTVELHRNTCFISIVGKIEAATNLKAKIKKMVDEIEEKIKRKKKLAKETLKLDYQKLKLLQMQKFNEKIEQEFEDMKVDIDTSAKCIVFTGMELDIKNSQVKMYELLNSYCCDQLFLTPHLYKFVSSWKATEYLQSKIDNKGYMALWEMKSGSEVLVQASNSEHLKSTISLIKSSFCEEILTLGNSHESLVDSERMDYHINSLHSTYGSKVECYKSEEKNKSKMHVVGCDDIHHEAVTQLKRFLKDNTILCEEHIMNKRKAEYITQFMRDKIDNEIAKHKKKYQMLIRPNQNTNKPGFVVECNKEGMVLARKMLSDLESSVSHLDHTVKISGAVRFFYDTTGQSCVIGLQYKHKVLIIMDNADENEVKGDHTVKAKAIFPNNNILYIAHGDLTKFQVDAIVNAADPKLEHGGGVAKAIVDQGGKSIQFECSNYMKTRKHMEPGEVYVSAAGTLPCKSIIHTVGPKWAGGTKDEELELFSAVYSPMEEANKCQMKRISMPAISTGKYGFPIDKACQILVGSVGSFLKENSSGSLCEIYIVDNNMNVVESCFEALIKNAGPGTYVENFEDDTVQGAVGGAGPSSSTSSSSTWAQGLNVHQIITTTGIRVSLLNDSITNMKTDVIVNLTSTNLDLNNGVVSKLILKIAGQSIQQECVKKAPNGIACGELMATSGGNNQYWKNIYHGSCSHYTVPSAKHELQSYMSRCLQKAHDDNMSSIAVPSLGTGSLMFPPREVARMMYHEVKKFSATNSKTSLQDIRFVVFDKPILKEFESHMQALLSGIEDDPVGKAKSTNSGCISSGWKKTGSAQHHEVVTPQGTAVKLYQGKLTDQKVDVIVNMTSTDLNLKSGAVSASILQEAGQAIQDECKKKQPNGIECGQLFVTGAGKLSCKKIFHGACSSFKVENGKVEMERYIAACLNEAHKCNMHSIAFPSMGTGTLGFPSKFIAKMMYTEVKKFAVAHKQTQLKDIRFVIFDSKVKKEYEQVANALPGKTRTLAEKKDGTTASDPPRYQHSHAFGTDENKSSWGYRKPAKKCNEGQKQEVTFRIYGTNGSTLKQVAKELDDTCKKEIAEKVIDDQEAIKKLSETQVSQIKRLDKDNDVTINLDRGKHSKITIQGPANNITDIVDRIYKIFRETDKREMQQNEIELLQIQAQWQYEEDEMWDQYPPEINAIIEKAHLEGKPFVQWDELQNTKLITYRIDFNSKMESCIQDQKRKLKVRRYVEGLLEESNKLLPSTWDTMKTGERLRVPTVKPGTPEYQDVVKAFDASINKVSGAAYSKVVQIQRVQTPLLYHNYITQKDHMEKTNPHSKNPSERVLWHATGKEVLSEINTNGFNRSFSGEKYGAWYGKGVYFATHAGLSAKAYTDKADKDKYMYKCRVLTGDYTQVKQERDKDNAIKTAPPKDPKNPAVKFDSTVDDQNSPNEWVIFTDAQAYPEYLITFNL